MKKMTQQHLLLGGLLALAISGTSAYGQSAISEASMREPIDVEGKVRELIVKTDDDQDFMTTKIYKLQYLQAPDIVPYLRSAVKRYGVGTVDRLIYQKAGEHYVSVTTARKLIPYMDSIIAVLDRPCDPSKIVIPYAYDPTKEARPTIIDGDGMCKVVYWPKYRHARAMYDAVIGADIPSGDGRVYYDKDHGFLYIKDSFSDAKGVLDYWRFLDRPLAQAELVFQIYEVTEQDAKELGIDWISWKNGPANGLPFFSTGLSGLQDWAGGIEKIFAAPDWMYGGVFFAPQFDASFLRLLANKAKIRSHTAVRQIVTHGQDAKIKFDPGFQNISKDEDLNIGVIQGAEQGINLNISETVLCFNHVDAKADAVENIMFTYAMQSNAIAGRSHLGTESVNTITSSGALTLQTGVEKVLSVYTAERDITQNNGWPILGDIPILKYLFSSETTIKATARYYLTVTAIPIRFDNLPQEPMNRVKAAAKPVPPALAELLEDEQ